MKKKDKVFPEFDKIKHVVELDPTLLSAADVRGGVIIATDSEYYKLERIEYEKED